MSVKMRLYNRGVTELHFGIVRFRSPYALLLTYVQFSKLTWLLANYLFLTGLGGFEPLCFTIPRCSKPVCTHVRQVPLMRKVGIEPTPFRDYRFTVCCNKPIVTFSPFCSKKDSNLHFTDFETATSAVGLLELIPEVRFELTLTCF